VALAVFDCKPVIAAYFGEHPHLLVRKFHSFSKMRQIFVDSRDRVPNSNSTTDFSILLPETLTLAGGVHRGRIDSLRVPMVIPTIQTGVNDTITVQWVNVTTFNASVVIDGGNYDGPTLASVLQANLNAQATGSSWTVVYDTANLALTVQCNYPFTITGGTYAAQLFSHPWVKSAPNKYRFTYVTTLGIDIMYLTSSRFSTIDTVGPAGQHDTLCAVNVTVPYGGVIDYSMRQDSWFNIPAMTAQTLDFQLRDRNYNILSIVPNISFLLLID